MKKNIQKTIIFIFTCIIFAAFSSITVFAQDNTAPKLSFSGKTSTSVTLSWTNQSSEKVSGYEISSYNKSTNTYSAVHTVNANTTSYTVSGLKSGSVYYYAVRSYSLDENGQKVYSSYSNCAETGTTPANPAITSISRGVNKLAVTFKKVNCSSYQIRYFSKSDLSDLTTVTVSGTATSAKLSNLLSGTKYYVQIRAVVTLPDTNTKICSSYSSKVKQVTKPAQMVISSTSTPSTTKIKANWKTVTATKYQLQYSTSSKFTSKKTVTLSNTTKSKTISGLTKGKTYYVRIRAYVTFNSEKIYGAWSEPKKQKIYTTKKLVTSTRLMTSNKWASKIICTVKKGSTVRYIGKSGRWYKVIYNGQTGYIYNLGFKKAGSTNISRSKVTAKNYTIYLDDVIFAKGKNKETLFKYVMSQMSYSYSKISSAQKKANINSLEKVKSNQAELTAVAIRKKGGICYNYAAYTKTLLQRAGYNVQYIYGTNKNGSHCWVIIKTAEGYRHLDAVRGAYLYTDKKMHSSSKTKDFTWDETKYPACVSK